MSDLIKVPYAELFVRAARIRQEAEAVRAEIQLLTETVESIQWMGKRAEKFFTLWQETKPEMETWAATLENFAASLEAQARSMQAADEGF
jgi:WXG100 family type VII secretion target